MYEFENQCEERKRNKIISVLSGRAYQNIDRNKMDFKFYRINIDNDPDFLKYASIIGAIIKNAGINNGSELSGILFSDSIISDIKDNPERFEQNLFYSGHPIFHDGMANDSASIRLNGYKMPDDLDRNSDAKGYFVGQGFLIQYRDEENNEKADFIEWDFWNNENTNEKLSRMLKESFFPFNI